MSGSAPTTPTKNRSAKSLDSSVSYYGLAELFDEIKNISSRADDSESFSLRNAIRGVENSDQMWCILTTMPDRKKMRLYLTSIQHLLASSITDSSCLLANRVDESIFGTRGVYRYMMRDNPDTMEHFTPHIAHTILYEAQHGRIANAKHADVASGIYINLTSLHDELDNIELRQDLSKDERNKIQEYTAYLDMHIKILNVALMAFKRLRQHDSQSKNLANILLFGDINTPVRGNKACLTEIILKALHPQKKVQVTPVRRADVPGSYGIKNKRIKTELASGSRRLSFSERLNEECCELSSTYSFGKREFTEQDLGVSYGGFSSSFLFSDNSKLASMSRKSVEDKDVDRTKGNTSRRKKYSFSRPGPE